LSCGFFCGRTADCQHPI